MEKIIEWLKDSNRWKHYTLGVAYGLMANDWYCAAYGGVGVAFALEVKDVLWGDKLDIVDALLTIAGVATGYGIRLAFENLTGLK